MPQFGAVQTPCSLAAGEKINVLNNENLVLNAKSMAVAIAPMPTVPYMGIVNNSGQSVALLASSDGVNYFPASSPWGSPVVVASQSAAVVVVAAGLLYCVSAVAAITGGTVTLSR